MDKLKSTRIFESIKILTLFLFFAVISLSFLKINLWDYDFWWHIATGRYIVENGSLPDRDLFSYTSALEENKNPFPERENFILKQYWLSQVIFYLLYDYAGPNGIIILRTTLLIATLFLVLLRFRKYSVSFPISFIFLFLLFYGLGRATGERPVLFTIFFTALTFIILDDFKSNKGKKIFLLVPLMLLWANMHGGFIIGVIIITVFMFGEGISLILKRVNYARNEIFVFYIAAAFAVLISFLNPTGWDAFYTALTAKYKLIYANTQEYESPFRLYRYKVFPIYYEYLSLVLLTIVVLLIRNKRISLTYIILLSGTLLMSFSAIRFIVYFMIIASMIIGKETDMLIKSLLLSRLPEKAYNRISFGLTTAVLLSLVLYASGTLKFDQFRFGIERSYFVPEAAVDFIEKNRLPGKMFNDYGYGGYIAWRLYPWKKNFIDTRALNLTVITEYDWIKNATESAKEVNPSISNTPLWQRLLNHYKINFILMSVLDLYGQIPPVVFELLESEKWVPVYYDPISIIFIRNVEQNKAMIKRNKISKDIIYNVIVYQCSNFALINKINPRYLISAGETFYRMGRLNDAVTAYRYALKRMPENQMIKERLAKIESELK